MAVSQKGIDVRQTGTSILFRAFLQDTAGALLGTGTTVISLLEYQSDGTIKSYDFNDNTFKTTALTTATLALTHRPSNNATTTTGLWTASLGTVSGFTVGAVYAVIMNNVLALPTDQLREFQYGSEQGDIVMTAGATGLAYPKIDVAGMLDTADTVETGLTLRGCFRLVVAANAAKLSGAATTTVVIRNAVADSKDRITATVDSNGNRSAITYDVT